MPSRYLSRRCLIASGLAMGLPLITGCRPHRDIGTDDESSISKTPQPIAREVTRQGATIPGPNGHPMTVWIYLPSPMVSNPPACVLIAPAGSPLFVGMDLGKGDVPEHYPYAQMGNVVVAYSLDGGIGDDQSNENIKRAFKEFSKAKAGIENARLALDYALKTIPQINPKKIYTAGHSSAGVLSLQVAESDPRIAGCIAYAPCTDFVARWGEGINETRTVLPEIDDFAKQYAPINHADRLRCPLFLFHADDDSNVPTSDNAAFADAVRRAGNKDVTFVRVPTGDHYNSMIEQGIPKAIDWLMSKAK